MNAISRARPSSDFLIRQGAELYFLPLCAALRAPSFIFFAFLTAALFRPPGVQFFPWDRILFVGLILVLMLRVFVSRQKLRFDRNVTLPLLGLLALASAEIVARPLDAQVWSIFAAKWLVPFVIFHAAGLLYDEPNFLDRFELLGLAVLAYLIFTAIAFLLGADGLIFPTYILDASLGMHADRARGPFLQAVANGMTLNLLGLIALNAFRRKRIRGPVAFLLLAMLPLAVIATRTRSVWLAFAGSILLLLYRSSNRRLNRACKGWVLAVAMGMVACVSLTDPQKSLADRLQDRSPVEFRMAMYEAGWEMFQSKPIVGWKSEAMRMELGKHISEFHQDVFYFHNTYLEIMVEHGLLGLGLYMWLTVGLFRLGGRRAIAGHGSGFLDVEFRAVWPVFLLVFLVNGSFVVMNYQFVNGLLFGLAGMLSAQNRRQESISRVA